MIDRDTRQALPNSMKNTLDKWEIGLVPSLLEMKVGSPGQYEGLTMQAKALKSFSDSMKNTIQDVGIVYFRAQADHTLTDGGKLNRSASYASKQIETARKRFQNLAADTMPALERYQEQFKQATKPPATAGEASIDAEIREWVRKQNVAEVAGLIRQNRDVMAAVVRAPAMLAGLNEDLHNEIKREYIAAVMPREAQEFEELSNLVRSANQALTTLEDESKKLIDFESAKKIEALKVVDL
jgi:hypothetical protein